MHIGNYTVEHQIAQGAFGIVYKCRHNNTFEAVVIKLAHQVKDGDYTHFENEKAVYDLLPSSWNYLEESGSLDGRPYLVMKNLGSSLDMVCRSLVEKADFVSVIAFICMSTIDACQSLHDAGFIHRDIKPQNFVMADDLKYQSKVRLIDFGNATHWYQSSCYQSRHIRFQSKQALCGTVAFCSINVHLGAVASRRDDMISLGYVMWYLIQGYLPWHKIGKPIIKNTQRYQCATLAKLLYPVDQLSKSILHDGLSCAMANYFTMTHFLAFDQKPPYEKLKECFASLL